MSDAPRDPRVQALLDTLRRSFDGGAWHGPALADALRGVDARAAATHPIPGAHSIWELALHLDAWTREVARRLGGSAPAEPRDGDWLEGAAASDAGWDAARASLAAARDLLLAAVATFPPGQLDHPLPRPEASGDVAGAPTYAVMLAGLAEHNAYHGGQVALLRRALALVPNASGRPAMTHTRLKVCCIASPDEARLAVAHGADALGLVSAMPSGPGVIDDATAAAVAARVPPPVATFLLTSRVDAASVVAQARAAGVTAVQLVDAVAPGELVALRSEMPSLRLVQVIHVLDEASVGEAAAALPHVHALLLDSGNPRLAVKELGGTGRVHDWGLSRRIREAADRAGVPVFLAGGLRAENVGEAVRAVRPFGVDVCSGVRTDGRLDAAKLATFAAALAAA